MKKQTLWLVLSVIAALLGAVSGGVGAALFIKHDTNF